MGGARLSTEANEAWLRSDAENVRRAIDAGIAAALKATARQTQLCDSIAAIKQSALEMEINCALGEYSRSDANRNTYFTKTMAAICAHITLTHAHTLCTANKIPPAGVS